MLSNLFSGLLRFLKWALVLGVTALLLARIITTLLSLPRLYTAETVPSRRLAVVFGAGLSRDGTPSPVLRDRIYTASQLYFSGKVEKILMSGDNRFLYYNEPGAMRDYAIQLGIPAEDIVLDYAGRRTYDTCYRLREVFKVDEVILITQKFHLPRALYTCNALNIAAVGVAADRRAYRRYALLVWNLREFLATLNALIEVHLLKPTPVLGEPEPIFPAEV